MRLLRLSIDKDGYTQPIVGWENEDGYRVEVVDGEHRTRVGKETQYIRERLHGHLPVTLIKQNREGRNDRIAATIRHNRARGVHGVVPMADIVAELIRLGWTDEEIAKELGMDADEVLRFKQNTGLPALFEEHAYSHAWE
jgi:ParB-like chromosome segregation protein Spo0J